MDFKKDIANIYEQIVTENFDEIVGNEIVEESLNRFILETDYTQLLDEGSGHGEMKDVRNMIKDAIKEGLVKRVEDTNSGWILYSAIDNSKFTSHRGEKNLHYIRRYLEGLRRLRKAA